MFLAFKRKIAVADQPPPQAEIHTAQDLHASVRAMGQQV